MNVVKRCALATVATGKNLADKAGAPLVRSLVAGSAVLVASGAHAAVTTVDTTDIVATISAGVTAISAIGVAVVSLVVVIKLFKWVQRTL